MSEDEILKRAFNEHCKDKKMWPGNGVMPWWQALPASFEYFCAGWKAHERKEKSDGGSNR